MPSVTVLAIAAPQTVAMNARRLTSSVPNRFAESDLLPAKPGRGLRYDAFGPSVGVRFSSSAVAKKCGYQFGLKLRSNFSVELQRNPTVNDQFEARDVFRLVRSKI
jgi:hypothetical protein